MNSLTTTSIPCSGILSLIFKLGFLCLSLLSCDKQEIPEEGLDEKLIGAWRMNTMVSKLFVEQDGQLIHNLVADTLFLFSFDEFGRYYDTLVNVRADTIKRAPKGTWEIGNNTLTLRDTIDTESTYTIGIKDNTTLSMSFDSIYTSPRVFEFKTLKYEYSFVSHLLTGNVQSVR